jgi:glycosyltransferase involved in cell wall biosynthesis
MKVAYLLADTALAGGIRVVMAQADALIARGHDVVLITTDAPAQWRSTRAQWERVARLVDASVDDCDFVVGTFWTVVPTAYALAPDHAIHFCQGYEGSFTAYQPQREAIDAVYRLPIPKITVSPHLVDICRQFYDDATYIGQIVDDVYYQPHAPRGGAPRVLLVGPMQADFKGIEIGYDAVRDARARGAKFDLIRVSQWSPADNEPVEIAAEFHVALDTAHMSRLIASCDIFLGPSLRQEGFGLPAAESLASGVPAVLSEIPSFLSWDAQRDFALFVGQGDADAMGHALLRLLDDGQLRERLAKRGREVVEQFRAERTGERLERFFSARLPRRTSGR